MSVSPFSVGLIEKLLKEAELEFAATPEVGERLQWLLHYSRFNSVSRTCSEFGIARSTFYRWSKRFNPSDLSTLCDSSTHPELALMGLEPVTSSRLSVEKKAEVRRSNPVSPTPLPQSDCSQCPFCTFWNALKRNNGRIAQWLLIGSLFVNAVLMTMLLASTASAAETLVNTESFNTIDPGDGSSDIELRFGATTEKILWDSDLSIFSVSDDIHITDNITGSGTIKTEGNAFFMQQVGIGTDALHEDSALEVADNDDSGSGAVFKLKSMKNTLEQNDVIGQIDFVTLDEGTESEPHTAGYIQFSAAQDWDTNNRGTELAFITTESGSTTPETHILIDKSGFVGINTGNPTEQLDVWGEIEFNINTEGDTTVGVCKNQSDGQGLNVEFRECNGTPSDVAEMFETELGVEAADIVVSTDSLYTYTETLNDPHTGLPLIYSGDTIVPTSDDFHPSARATKDSQIAILAKADKAQNKKPLGVISTNPFAVYGRGNMSSALNPQPLAIAGRVPVKVTSENGPIAAGDSIAVSSTVGHGMKAVHEGWSIGTALESFECAEGESACTGTVMTFISTTWFTPELDGLDMQNIAESDIGLEDVLKLQPVSFNTVDSLDNVGFVPQDAAEVNTLFAQEEDGVFTGIRFESITTALVNAVKELEKRIDILETKKDPAIGSTVEIENGALQITSAHHYIRNEGDSAHDDITTLAGKTVGQVVTLQIAEFGKEVSVQNSSTLHLTSPWRMTKPAQRLTLLNTDGTHWVEISRVQ